MSRLSKAQVLSAMVLREPLRRYKGLHPNTIDRLVRLTKKLEPLKYKLHQKEVDIALPHAPPLGPVSPLPFHVERSASGNLPVYVRYRNSRAIKRTIIRKLSGDIDAFSKELTKVVSNNNVNIKVGRVEVPGIHRESVNTWLLRLGL
jgi:large subunit ribosomal protein L49